ncbi:hypothetical protein A2701_00800 [Candidatus Amesbacteria bacterium RIFCSPHIGHO2_01_FULL_47_34]|uniref:Uncharacterized protein n=4 Tax=Candidatus Amesiibacteriota TaxID=1752730 RepID=A0A1F4ZRT8_9BACT|nr:MAG: hypothetical protein UX35_C0020G0005 [Microgenomates group bacterium GW2011_GWA1_46_15]KKU62726.1 MAG: hypothetical protein UX86_C0044G0015 [Candidatus Amesbacteria bacterium GW2011_GWC1_47_15]KKU95435.1 MAG: hypothetical protein UY28_C0051G0004 [Candidatus Amesbacteria bacterium GW2011_GWB1_48_13]OGC98866.1 MAG: hypothetical protein A2701_00800 [Candidatus Amesbacteria bacterium RIFCSPHIGHO2_01_FULL_47_34]OGD00658.1 MAG: hypothetical protein A2972_04295 [Candidatus Amesbacteria bacteri
MNNELIGVQLLKSFMGVSPWMVVKAFMIVGLILYMVFALVIVKQVGIMTESVEADANGVVKLLAWAHLLMTIGVIVLLILI